jgi:outer membrane protein assembly factor BamD
VTISRINAGSVPVARLVMAGALAVTLAGCGMFGGNKIKEEPIVPADVQYNLAIKQMDEQKYMTAAESLQKLQRQHPDSEYFEKAKLMEVFANYRIGKFDDAIAAADRYLALYPSSKEVPYILFLKGNSYFGQIKDITRDQQISQNAIDTYSLILSNYPDSPYAKDARERLATGFDQLAGKEMSVGRYYLGNGNYVAAINRFTLVAEKYQTSSQIEEALFRLTEANLALGLISEAQTAAAVLGHNYPQSSWYKEAYDLLQKQGISPQVNASSKLAKLDKKS